MEEVSATSILIFIVRPSSIDCHDLQDLNPPETFKKGITMNKDGAWTEDVGSKSNPPVYRKGTNSS